MSHHPLSADDFAHACHGLVDGPGTRIHDKSPDLKTDLVAGKNSPGMGVKIVEQRLLTRLESHAMIWVHVRRDVVMEITCVIYRKPERRSNAICAHLIFFLAAPLFSSSFPGILPSGRGPCLDNHCIRFLLKRTAIEVLEEFLRAKPAARNSRSIPGS
jgi:hypothetical protein